MSSDVMIVCKEYNNDCYQLIKAANDGTPLPKLTRKEEEQAWCIDEASMGDPWTDFGRWFVSRYCKAPGIFEQLAGITTHSYTLFRKVDYQNVKNALKSMENTIENEKDFLAYMKNLIGKHISTENW